MRDKQGKKKKKKKKRFKILAPTTPIGKKKFQGTTPTTHFSALISLGPEK
jgi:hypothetical protein